MRLDHPAHPDRFAAKIEIIRARGGAGRDQFGAIELIRTYGANDGFGLSHHRLQRGEIARIGDDQRRVGRRADSVTHGSKLVLAAAGHRPFQGGVALVMRREILGDELAGETGGAIDDDVEFRRRHIRFSPKTRHCLQQTRSVCAREQSDGAIHISTSRQWIASLRPQ